MQLVEKGLLSLTDPLSKFIPNFPRAQEITIHHLLTHTSGIVNYTTLPEYEELKIKPTTPEKIIALIQNKQPNFNPGEKFSYSNSGYTLLTYIIEKTAGMSYSDYLQKNIFNPLAMQDTGYDDKSIVLKNRASGYIKDDNNTLKNAPYRDMSLLSGAGGLYSTVEDLFKFHRALASKTILKKESIDTMFTTYQGNHGYGCTIGNIGDKKFVCGIGGMSGFSSIFMHFPDNNICISLLSNFGFTNSEKIAHDVAEIILNQLTNAEK
jgi:CubicO group peptidase (beta-lactamase class C family)